MNVRKILAIGIAMSISYSLMLANNLQISNVTVNNINNTDLYANISFGISWENSWRDTENWDAVWVFAKYRNTGDSGSWSHATLSPAGHTEPPGATFFTPDDGKGAFIYRNTNGNGISDFADTGLRWDFGADGLTSADEVDIKVFGIEMVYVPRGSFYVGDGQTDGSQLYGNFESGNTGAAFLVSSENGFTVGGGAAGSLGNNNATNQFNSDTTCGGCLDGSGDDFDDAAAQALPNNFPKGYESFYCMKYETTQQQFVDMLNCLDPNQQTTYLTQTGDFYFTGTLSENRYDITLAGGQYTTGDPYIPMIFFDWVKSAAYADWAALRPMTELEFEKACRGFAVPVPDEYAWGNANVDLSDNLILSNEGAGAEAVSSGYDGGGINGNAWMRAGSQTMPNVARVGIFAAHASNTGRISGGSSAWGIMELSGNAWERAVSVGHPEGRKFTGLHGDGYVNADGYADVPNWPGTETGTVVDSNIGVGYRGGALAYPTPNLERNARVSSRRLASGYWDTVINDDGARFVRAGN